MSRRLMELLTYAQVNKEFLMEMLTNSEHGIL